MVRKVLASLENLHGDYCVDLFQRGDGSYGFEEYRRDPEDGRWRSLHRYSAQVVASLEEARTLARSCVPWLREDEV